ncbi:alpha/beta hydrolase-fold protein [Novosphingobium sp. 1949]|uniref:Alpha/beta hydrolase-fold protein n=1 Tax=Novosphingobium organovorum TaxID=2930092 RepID=A0ABT0BHJ0_9SPHN|nr:alpha/beta hydrolase-fold protein [Novosphingobium organovorum]MCJ2184276.1 alpha/beta hydrolase-fold protein [Novosphingobium organovorum]
MSVSVSVRVRRLALASLGVLTLGAAPVAVAAAPVSSAATPQKPPRIETFDRTGPQGRVYRISIAHPDAPPPPSGYPVVYVLDGNALFATAADSARLQAFRPNWTGMEAAVVVGIGYPTPALFDVPARYYDLTTPLPGGGASLTGGPRMKAGGADDFLAFLESTVKPLVAAHASLDRSRQTLLGHSLGGLCVLHALFSEPGAFSSYVAISPSAWWGGGSLMAEARAFRARRMQAADGPAPRVLLTVGEYEQTMSPAARAASGAAEQEAALARAGMVDAVHAMARLLEETPHLTTRYRLLDGEDHGSGVPRAISLGLRFALLPDGQFDPAP